MNTEELLKPRYEVIADYPGNPFKVGQVLSLEEADEIVDFPENLFEPYPHLFRKLEWWEERSKSEIKSIQYLKLVKGDNAGQIGKVDKWTGEPLYAIVGRFAWQLEYGAFEPATETEYLNHLNDKQ